MKNEQKNQYMTRFERKRVQYDSESKTETYRKVFFTNNLARGLAQKRGCNDLLSHAVGARPRASLHGLQSSLNISDRVTLSLLLQHSTLRNQLRQFSLKTRLKRPVLSQH